ncbi:hypothetical protein RQP54_11300 [Curvibacter sp. APW13]|uniref:hypothetical protein n=1 Tax=Curvibacter sp. APW13 TaxID=3077236 RepID=UPI0028DED8A3|nr:hypothetical protein [Curvibacter sp. APW13]MDT8991447.1 hypothetical protein [Curvibacter sp. APW13]
MNTEDSPRLRPFLGAVGLASCAQFLSSLKVHKSEILLQHLLDLDVIPPVTLLFLATLGISIYRAIPGGHFNFFVRNCDSHHKAFSVYGPIGGALVGCAIVLSGFELWYQGSSAIPAVAHIWFLLALVVGTPICAYIVACVAIAHYRSQVPLQKSRPMLIKALAAFFVFASVMGVRDWYTS